MSPLHVFVYGITIGLLDAVATVTLMPAAVTTAATSTRSFFMTSSLGSRLLRMPTSERPQRGIEPEPRLRCHPPIRGGCQHGDAASGAEPADLVREALDVDRLLEVAGESAVREPGIVSCECDRAQ